VTTPKLVVFDFGGTLFLDGPYSLRDGLDALRRSALNPGAVTTTQLCEMMEDIELRAERCLADSPADRLEIRLQEKLRCLIARSGLRFPFGLKQCELVFDEADSTRERTPYMDELLAYLAQKGIRTGVISNISLSGEAMKAIVDRWYPGNEMSFVFTSADFLFCKPGADMFLAAAKTAGLEPEECLYCGDSVSADVDGALGAGMQAVLYDTANTRGSETRMRNGREYTAVGGWEHLIALLERL